MTQNEKILRHLRMFGSINPIEAFQEYGILRLGARIYDLKSQGYSIASSMQTGKNRFGETVYFSEYTLKG